MKRLRPILYLISIFGSAMYLWATFYGLIWWFYRGRQNGIHWPLIQGIILSITIVASLCANAIFGGFARRFILVIILFITAIFLVKIPTEIICVPIYACALVSNIILSNNAKEATVSKQSKAERQGDR